MLINTYHDMPILSRPYTTGRILGLNRQNRVLNAAVNVATVDCHENSATACSFVHASYSSSHVIPQLRSGMMLKRAGIN